MNRYLQGLVDLVFPPRCMACSILLSGPANETFCPPCHKLIRFISSPICPCCGMPFGGTAAADHLCGDCLLSRPSFSMARAAARYESVLLEVIHAFKYRGQIATGEILGKMMAARAYPGFDITAYSLLVPVPLHLKRLRERGFNQSVILAREIAKRFAIPLDFMSLQRRVFTDPQVGLGKDRRAENVKDAFTVENGKKLEGQKILLVDDVYTTGSTVKECTDVLMQHGAEEVAVLTLARAIQD